MLLTSVTVFQVSKICVTSMTGCLCVGCLSCVRCLRSVLVTSMTDCFQLSKICVGDLNDKVTGFRSSTSITGCLHVSKIVDLCFRCLRSVTLNLRSVT